MDNTTKHTHKIHLRLVNSGRAILVALALASFTGTGLAAEKQIRILDLEYSKPDGKALKLDLYLPKNATNPLPVILWIPGEQWKAPDKKRCRITKMADLGFAIASLNYRSPLEASFPAPLHDCKAAVRWLRANSARYNLNMASIGAFGVSSGGQLACLLGTTGNDPSLEGDRSPAFSSRIQAVCAIAAPVDLSTILTNQTFAKQAQNPIYHLLGGQSGTAALLAEQANPIKHASRDDALFFIVHCRKDKIVPEIQSILFYNELLHQDVRCTLRFISGGHGDWPNPETLTEINYFFDKHLRRGIGRRPG